MLQILNLFFGLSSLITEVPVDPGITVGSIYLIVEGYFSLFLRLAHFAISCELRSTHVVDADHEVPLSLGVVGVNTSPRTLDWSLIFRGEGDIGQNSPSVKS